MMRLRLVADTNVLVSRLLLPRSQPAQALRWAVDHGQLLVSDATLAELADVLARPKFDRYVSIDDRRGFLLRFMRITEKIDVLRRVQACQDPRDDKFLEVAVNGEAKAIITGDAALLALHPFLDVAIVTPATFLADYVARGNDNPLSEP